MSTKLDDRQTVHRSALPMVGSSANDSLDTIFPKIDNEIAKLFEDRNLTLVDGGLISYNAAGTSVSFSQSLVLILNSTVAGSTPVNINLASTTRTVSAIGRMIYAVINRTAGTATVTDDAATLPAVTSANEEVILIAKRSDSVDGTPRLYFRDGSALFAGQIRRLGTNDFLQNLSSNDSTSTGSNATLTAFVSGTIRLTNSSLSSISGIPAAASGQLLILENKTGSRITVNNEEATATAANRIQTGTGINAQMPNNSTLLLSYDTTSSRWQLVGGTASGSGGGGSKNYLTAISTSLGGTVQNTGNGDFELGTTTGWSLFNTTLTWINTLTFTVTIASPAVFTTPSAHNLTLGQAINFTTTGSLPTGLVVGTTYYVTSIPTSTTFNVSANYAGANVNTTGSQSGTHTMQAIARPSGSISAGATSVTTFNTVGSGQLAGSASLQTSSSSNWLAGQGFISDAFFVDLEDQAKQMTFKAYYKAVTNPANAQFQGNSSNTFAVYFYDVTNSLWIQPSGVYGITQNSGSGYVTGTFQTSSNGTQYRLAILAINSTSGAVTMYWDDLSVGPQTAPLGAAVSDWQSYTPTFSPGFGSVTNISGKFRRNGDEMEIRVGCTSGSIAASLAFFTLPVGYQIDATKLTRPSNNTSNSGSDIGKYNGGAADVDGGSCITAPGTSLVNIYCGGYYSASIVKLTPQNGSSIFNSGADYELSATVPIVGWSSNVQMSTPYDGRQIVSIYSLITAVSITAGNPINFDKKIQDDAGSVSTGATTWRFIAPTSGDYQVTISIFDAVSTGINDAILYLNGAKYAQMGSFASSNVGKGSTIVPMFAGDFIDLRFAKTFTPTAGGAVFTIDQGNFITIYKVSGGSSVIAATETIAASYWCSANQSTSTTQPINFDSREYDTHAAVTTGSGWNFRAPAPGFYTVGGFVQQTGSANGGYLIYKNGTAYKALGTLNGTASSVTPNNTIFLNAGDVIDIRNTTSIGIIGGALSGNTTGNIWIKRSN